MFIILISVILVSQVSFCQEAVVIKPVIDLLTQKMCAIHTNSDYYGQIPLSPFSWADLKSCPRVHQILFNEIVKIIKTEGQEVLIEIPRVYYQTFGNNKKNNSFWTQKSNLVSLTNIDLSKIPGKTSASILTLIFPFKDAITGKTYSAGTRFVYVEPENSQDYIIYIFDPENNAFKESNLPKDFCITQEYTKHLSRQKKINNFVSILKKWANLKNGFIPYVWGGYSFCNTSTTKFETTESTFQKTKVKYFAYPDFQENPKTGFDCSNLILAAAQLSGIPFCFKNTTTILQNLQALKKEDTISPGDIIWIPGHVIVITDTNKNLCVEARGYVNNGYGRVHETSLKTLFKNLNTFNDLKDAFFNKKPIYRIDRFGNIFETITNFKILKIESCWQCVNLNTTNL